jgi:hypothetical protein
VKKEWKDETRREDGWCMRTDEENSARGGAWAPPMGKEQLWGCFGGGEDAAGVHSTGEVANQNRSDENRNSPCWGIDTDATTDRYKIISNDDGGGVNVESATLSFPGAPALSNTGEELFW